jgi:heptosyltransferase I
MNLCIFRLSALGDATHVLALIDAIQQDARAQFWRIVWVLGPGEAKLVAGLPGVELVVYDKRHGFKGALALRQKLRTMLGGKSFDVLLQLQLALRANIVSRMIPAQRRIGFDRVRSKELHSAVINERIDASAGPHVLDAMLGFLQPLGLTRPKTLRWPLVLPDAAHAFAKQYLPDGKRYLVISPCSSHRLRNWLPERYAEVANFAATELGLTPVLVGGKSAVEIAMAEQIRAALRVDFIDLVGKDTLKQLLGVLQRASVVLSPDSGPAHMAQALATPVVGLYAATDPGRSGPYCCQNLCTNHYAQAAQQFLGKSVTSLRWGQKVEREGVMALISVAEVCELLRKALSASFRFETWTHD